MRIDRTLLAAGALLLLSGCEHGMMGAPQDAAEFGEPNRQTMMAQVVDPDPQYEEPLETSGEHAAQAIERYRTDRVKQPARVRSTQNQGGGGGGN
jgi:hypothetical protein